jgi:hypothetical protein
MNQLQNKHSETKKLDTKEYKVYHHFIQNCRTHETKQ